MKKYGKGIFRTLIFAAILLLYVLAQRQARILTACERTALILLESSPLTGADVETMRRTEQEQKQPREFAAWSQENEVKAENVDLARTHTVATVAVCGRSDLILEGTARLDADDRDGCLIDANTAQKLFGNTNVIGLSVELSGKKKTIRGILYDTEDTVVYEESSSDAKFTNLTVSTGGSISYENLRQDFMARHALDGKFVRMDTLGWILGLLVLMIPLVLGCRLLMRCLQAAAAYRRERGGLFLLAATAVCAVLFFWLIVGQISLPADMIPTKWSDFGFWSDFLQKERQSLLLLLLTEKQKPLQGFIESFYLGAGECLAAVILALKVKI